MTVWAFLADVHGSYRALARAATLAGERGAERFVVLGDLLGRGQPGECVAWVRDHAALAVVGNRDRDHADLVDPAQRAYLAGLPLVAGADGFLISHGDASLTRELGSADERRGFRRAYAALRAAGKRLWFYGHTHHARVWRKDGPDSPPLLLPAASLALDLADPATCYVVNVGTTGRRLAGRGPASFTLWDDARALLERVEL